MPTRMLREGILTSARVNSLTAAEEVFYRRVMSVVDDYGRYFALPGLLIAACYPLRIKTTTERSIELWLKALCDASLITLYEAKGARYLEMVDFRQQVRAVKSKYPGPDTGELVDPSAPAAKREKKQAALNGAFLSFWDAYPRHLNRADAEKEWVSIDPDDALVARIVEAVEAQKRSADWTKENGKYIPHAFRWLKKRRWEDEIPPARDPDELVI